MKTSRLLHTCTPRSTITFEQLTGKMRIRILWMSRGGCYLRRSILLSNDCTLAELHIRRVITLDYRIRLLSTRLNTYHTLPKLGLWATAILMASPYLHEGEEMQIPAQLTLRDGPEVLAKYMWIFIRQGVTHGRHHAHDRGNGTLIVLYQATNGDH